MAKILGYQCATNTTVYRETDVQELEDMFKFLSSLDVDGHTISPGYDYDAAKKDMVKRLGKDPKEFFLTRDMTRKKFAKIEEWGRLFTIFGTPVYQEFLAGKRELTCTAWAIPTYNVKGWKAPCYLMTDGHYPTYGEMLGTVKWESYGVVDGKARDPRCEHCMVHCGYDPSGALSSKGSQPNSPSQRTGQPRGNLQMMFVRRRLPLRDRLLSQAATKNQKGRQENPLRVNTHHRPSDFFGR